MEDQWQRLVNLLSLLEGKCRIVTSSLNAVIKRIKFQTDHTHSHAYSKLESTIDSTYYALSKQEENLNEWLRQQGKLGTGPSTRESCESATLTQDNTSEPQALQCFEKLMEERIASLEKSISDHVTADQSLESSLRTALVMLASVKQSSKGHQLEVRVSQLEALIASAKSSDQAVDGTFKNVTDVHSRNPGGASGGIEVGRPEFRRSTDSEFRRSGLPEVRRAALLQHAENADTEIHVTPVLDQERDLRQYEENCPHRDRHDQFLEIDQFSLNDLPEEFRDDTLLKDCVTRGLASLSARIKLKSTSAKRPAMFPDSMRKYPFGWLRGCEMTRLGSGWVVGVKKGSQQAWQINILTATHLLYDESEAKDCEIDLIVHGRRHTLSGGKWVKTKGDRIWRDLSELEFHTNDVELGEGLQTLLTSTLQTMEKLDKIHERKDVDGGLVLMVCHPHGAVRAKISVGRAKSLEVEERDDVKYGRLCFTGESCVGCSGACVVSLGYKHSEWARVIGLPFSGRNDQGDLMTGWRW